MTNPFEGRVLGGRQTAPQFPQRRAIRRRDGGKTTPVDSKGRRVISVDQAEKEALDYDKRNGQYSMDQSPIGKSMYPILQYAEGGKTLPDLSPEAMLQRFRNFGNSPLSAEAEALRQRLLKIQEIDPTVKRYARGGDVPGLFFGGLFGGSPGSTTQSQQGSSSSQIDNPTYNNLRDTVVGQARNVIDMPFTPYTGEAVAPLTGDQNTAFANIRSNQGNYSPFFNQAGTSLNNVAGMNPTSAGMGYINEAGQAPTGSEAASPFVDQASQTFPGAINQYMSPYTQNVTDRIATLGARNLNEKLLPGINDTFSGGNAAQFGRERHADIAGRALRDTQESVLGQQAQALEQGYGTAANIFSSDANRAAGLANTTGNLAQGDVRNTANLGTAAGNLTAQGVQTGLQTAGAQQGLGQATQAAAGTDANALATSGGIQQTANQNQDTFDYNQWQQGQNNTINRLQQAQALGQGWQLPTTNSYQSTGTSTTTQPAGSAAAGGLGGLMGLASLAQPGASGTSALGNIFGGMFGSGGVGSNGSSPAMQAGFPGMAGVGSGTQFAVGGMVPTISQMRKHNAPQGMAPTGMPGMPPMAPTGPMPRQPNGQMQSPFARGGYVPGYEDGGVLHGILGAAGSMLGNLIPIPVVGPTVGHFLGHTASNVISGDTANIDNDAAQDFAAPLPFGIGSMLSNAAVGPDTPDQGDQIEGMAGQFSPFAKMGMNAGMSMFRRGGRVDCGPEHDWKVRRGDITARFAQGGYTPFQMRA